jgi:phosphohistidine phosphatase
MRHAKSDQSDTKVKEHKRPLTKKGERYAIQMGEWLKAQNIQPDLMLSSPAVRACRTAELVKEQLGYTGDLKLYDDLYMAESDEIIKILKELPDEVGSVMLVGHNPGLESLIPLFTKEVESLPTASFANLQLPIEHWSELKHKTRAELVTLQRPKTLKKDKAEAEVENKPKKHSKKHINGE